MFARLWILCVLMFGVSLFGCGEGTATKSAAKGTPSQGGSAAGMPEEKMAQEITPPEVSSAEIAKNLASLDPSDREKALAQKLCPVSLHPLGSMSGCMKVNYKGEDVFLCCEGCKADFEKDSDGCMAKLAEAKKKAQ
jgi:hypothetical protein